MRLGQRVRQLREQRGLSLAQVADGFCSRAFLHQVEQGKSHPSVRVLGSIAERLGASVDDLLEGEGHFLSRQLGIEQARLAMAQGNPARALQLLGYPDSNQDQPLGFESSLCTAEALLALDRGSEAMTLLTVEESLARANSDQLRLAQIAAVRQGRPHQLSAAGHQRAAEQAMRSGDTAAALEHARAARILVEAERSSPRRNRWPASKEGGMGR
jgi:transcriptional regulator with XRE-family HTH domain